MMNLHSVVYQIGVNWRRRRKTLGLRLEAVVQVSIVICGLDRAIHWRVKYGN